MWKQQDSELLLGIARFFDWVIRVSRLLSLQMWKWSIFWRLWYREHIPLRVSFNPRLVVVFTGFNLAMGCALIYGDGNVSVLPSRALAHHWDLIYGVSFLLVGVFTSLGLLRWRGMTGKAYLRIRRWSSGAGLTVALGWTLLEVTSAFRDTQDWTVAVPWIATVFAYIVSMERLRQDMSLLPSQLEELRQEQANDHG